MASSEAQLAALVAAQAQARQKVADATTSGVRAEIAAFAAWYSDPEIAKFVERIVRRTSAGARATAALTDSYLARALALISGRRIRPAGVARLDNLRQKAAPAEVYERLAVQYRYLVSTDVSPVAALHRVTERAAVMAETDTLLAYRRQVERFLDDHDDAGEVEVTGYRRIVRPELSAGGTCGLCVIAADRLYYRSDLLAIHGQCKCEVLPVIDGVDMGKDLNDADLRAIYDAAGGNTGKKLKRVRITVEEHGELGAVLVDADHHFRGPEEVAA